MPAKNIIRTAEKVIYSHVYNKGIDKRVIFNSDEDYQVFIGYLKDYLTPPDDSESAKKIFTVHGRTFRGVPHRPKNYFNKIELVAYSLRPDHFHLILHQNTKNSIERFIRSLCTRYSMYFNKKYKRSGALFDGPYKSVQLNDMTSLLYLSHYMHHGCLYSSYPEYLGQRQTSWVKPEVVLAFFEKAENDFLKGVNGYNDFVEKYKLDQKEIDLLKRVAIENEIQHVEASVNTPNSAPTLVSIKPNTQSRDLPPLQRVPELLGMTAVFFVLTAFGIRNINANAKLVISSNPSPLPITATTPAPSTGSTSFTGQAVFSEVNNEVLSASDSAISSETAKILESGRLILSATNSGELSASSGASISPKTMESNK